MTTTVFPHWTRIVPPAAGLWYAFGLSQCILAVAADANAAPMAIWLIYALACVAGILGSAALAFAPAQASKAFAVSLLAAGTYFGWLFAFGQPRPEEYGIGAVVLLVTLVLLITSRR